MGRSYALELRQLNHTRKWAMTADVSALRRAVANAASSPLMAVGSGGSLSLAALAATLHRMCTGRPGLVATPLEASSGPVASDLAVWLFSAGGGNPDILDAFSDLAKCEPRQLAIVCGRKGSRLANAARAYGCVDLVEFPNPDGRDGFLATNSLVAAALLVARAYAENFGVEDLPAGRINSRFFDDFPPHELRSACECLWHRETLIVLHGLSTRCGALDIESKFTEAALGNVQISDFRNFAHGRHHWLAKRGEQSAILAISSSDDADLARRTLALIPAKIPRVRVELDGNRFAVPAASLLFSVHLAGWAGAAKGIDPGRPGVPEFGRRLYHMRPRRRAARTSRRQILESAAVTRKTGSLLQDLHRRGELGAWVTAYRRFCTGISQQAFRALVVDYDGTLVDVRDRLAPPSPKVSAQLQRLLKAGLVLGIATGRGQSVRKDLRACLPQSLWSHIVVGYYNGGDIGRLDDESRPNREAPPGPELAAILSELIKYPGLNLIAETIVRAPQITLHPRDLLSPDRLWDLAQSIVSRQVGGLVRVVRSGHSVDILAPGVSKRAVVRAVQDAVAGAAILVIGDRGRWPGNDHELLAEQWALSVDEVSADPMTCWHLATLGHRGVDAFVDYCRALVLTGMRARLDLARIPVR